MSHRRAFSLLELLVVIAILGVLAAMTMGGLQRARAAAHRIQCVNNLRQISVALEQYDTINGTLPQARFCPDVTPVDPDCKTVGDATPTGPNEVWWAPYDNRPGATPTQPLGDENFDHGPLWSLLEENKKVFQCPDGIDDRPGSPSFGKQFQVSYAMNFVTGGPSGQSLTMISNNNGTANVMLVWDHMNSPACATYGYPRLPCKPYTEPQSTHYPQRHHGSWNVLFCDGHVVSMVVAALQDQLFMAY